MTLYFAVMDETDHVENVILAESKEIAEELTQRKCIEFNPELGICGIGSKWTGTEFLLSLYGANPDAPTPSIPE